VREYPDPPEVVQRKIKELADLIRKSQYMVAYTGAGISTSAGIPDFRGPQGVWTLRAKGLSPSRTYRGPLQPTATHMSLVKLQEIGKLKFLVSQNTDGLHLRSGIPINQIAELHGNTNLEQCTYCGKRWYRAYSTRSARGVKEHETGRRCPKCNGGLKDTIVNFGEGLPGDQLEAAMRNSGKADLAIILGSSMRVSPACDMPLSVARRGHPLVIVNLQRTPLDQVCRLRIGAKTDEVMSGVMAELGEDVPPSRDLITELAERSEEEAREEREVPLPQVNEDLEGLRGKPTRELIRILRERGIPYGDLLEKEDYARRVFDRCRGVTYYKRVPA